MAGQVLGDVRLSGTDQDPACQAVLTRGMGEVRRAHGRGAPCEVRGDVRGDVRSGRR